MVMFEIFFQFMKCGKQDTLRHWDVGAATNPNLFLCSFCKLIPDSHDHVFFECSFPSQVWNMVRVMAAMDDVAPA